MSSVSVIIATTGPSAAEPAWARRITDADAGVEVLVVGGTGLGEAWNRGARTARGDLLVFLPADFDPAPTLLGQHRAVHAAGSDRVVVGEVRWVGGRGLASHLNELAPGDVARVRDDPVPVTAFPGRTISLRRDRFERVGGFAEGLAWGAEAELAFRLLGAGTSLCRTPDTVGTRPAPRSLGAIAAAREREGRGSVQLYHRVPAMLPHLELGAFSAASHRSRLVRRLLLALGGPVWPLRPATALGAASFDWYRLVYAYLFWRGVWRAQPDREIRRRLAHGPVVLMYHAIGGPNERAGVYTVPADRFAGQVACLRLLGYRIVGLEALLQDRRSHRLPPARSVALTFDDGYEDNHSLAFPVLARRRLPATIFLVSQRLGASNTWDATGELAGRPLFGVTQVREMMSAAIEFGAHTRTHVALPEIGEAAAQAEIAGSRTDLERELARPVRTFAYPYGRMSPAVQALVARAGFQAACCSRSGTNDPAMPDFALRRIEVRGTDSLLAFALAVWRGRAPRRPKARA